MHLLVFTDLPDTSRFAAHVDVRDAWSLAATVRGAWVRDWDALLADGELRLTGTERRFLENSSVVRRRARHQPVRAGQPANWDGHYAQRVLEAVIIATGTAELLQVAGTAKLGELKARYESLSAGGPPQ